MRRMNEYVCPTLRGSKDLLRLADLQHAHMDFFYAGEPNGLNARARIIHICPVANITGPPGILQRCAPHNDMSAEVMSGITA